MKAEIHFFNKNHTGFVHGVPIVRVRDDRIALSLAVSKLIISRGGYFRLYQTGETWGVSMTSLMSKAYKASKNTRYLIKPEEFNVQDGDYLLVERDNNLWEAVKYD